MSIEERLEQIELSASGKGAAKGSSSLQTDSFAVLLVQGLESKDEKILNVSYTLLSLQTYTTDCCNQLKYDHFVYVHRKLVSEHCSCCHSCCSFKQKIFQTKKDALIKNTVSRLPPPAILPLLEEVCCIGDIK